VKKTWFVQISGKDSCKREHQSFRFVTLVF